ncbi:MAG TPA: hypothetical protein VM681_01010 [Candidatus Thermoplasmatota archaeon]|nr:hypothetical protein [Candidatus Thermoplasmatota archaeon]
MRARWLALSSLLLAAAPALAQPSVGVETTTTVRFAWERIDLGDAYFASVDGTVTYTIACSGPASRATRIELEATGLPMTSLSVSPATIEVLAGRDCTPPERRAYEHAFVLSFTWPRDCSREGGAAVAAVAHDNPPYAVSQDSKSVRVEKSVLPGHCGQASAAWDDDPPPTTRERSTPFAAAPLWLLALAALLLARRKPR